MNFKCEPHPTFQIGLELSHADNYTCVAENPHGSDSTTWRVIVLRPPAAPGLALLEARPRELELELRPAPKAPGHALPKSYSLHWRLASPEVRICTVLLSISITEHRESLRTYIPQGNNIGKPAFFFIENDLELDLFFR